MSAPITIAVDQGDTENFTIFVTYPDPTSVTEPQATLPQDLTGCTARMSVRQSYASQSIIFTLTDAPGGGIVLGGTAGSIDITMSAAQTLLLTVPVPSNYSVKSGPPTQYYVADVNVTFPSGNVERYGNFIFIVSAVVTR